MQLIFHDIVLIINPDKDITIKATTALPIISSARVHVQQVFQNLIDNAIKHHDKKTPIIIEISVKEYEDYIACSVKDNGPGIPQDQHNKVFEVFQRLVRRDEVEGTGIGLALVKKLVELHGSDLQIISAPPERGCEFKFNWRKEGNLNDNN